MQLVVWVWGILGLSWVTGSGGGVGVPGGVSWGGAGLVDSGGLVGVGADVGNWVHSQLHGGGGSDEHGNGKLVHFVFI